MASMFLLYESIDVIDFNAFQSGVDDLILIEKEDNDAFFKNDSFYNLENYAELYQNPSQENQFRTEYLEKLPAIDSDPKTVNELSVTFPEQISGFFGINFPQLAIDENRCVNNNSKFKTFKAFFLTLISHTNFSVLKVDCFPNIIFCGNSEEQLISYGNSKYFNQCIDQFVVLEEYLSSWNEGNFQYQDLSASTSVTITPESNSTMNNYKSERVFSLPNGGTDVFELHIKLGDIRIHVLEDNSKKKIMIGYIGKHLTI